MKLFEIIFEIFGWIQIVVGVTLGAGLIAGIIYIKWSGETGKIIAIIVLSIGFLSGIIWATRIWTKHSTIEWLSRIGKSQN
jgi:ABC-type multidrug transport system permease subunit